MARSRPVRTHPAGPNSPVPVVLQNRQHAVTINLARLRRTAKAVLAAARTGDAELSLMLVSDRRMRALNSRYRKQDRSTDVLAFPLTVPSIPPLCKGRLGGVESLGKLYLPSPLLTKEGNLRQPPVLLGDVVISLPTARRQAAERGHGLFDEVIRLLVHGVLHLLGYDHERGLREAARMARRERAILRTLTSKHIANNVGAGNPAQGRADQYSARSKREGVNPSPTRK